MMTLSDIAQLVCDKIGKTDEESLAICKRFIRQRYKMLHDMHLWKDTLDTLTWSNNLEAMSSSVPDGVHTATVAMELDMSAGGDFSGLHAVGATVDGHVLETGDTVLIIGTDDNNPGGLIAAGGSAFIEWTRNDAYVKVLSGSVYRGRFFKATFEEPYFDDTPVIESIDEYFPDRGFFGLDYERHIIAPEWVDKILLVVRGTDTLLDPQHLITTFLREPNRFIESGDSLAFHSLSPIAISKNLGFTVDGESAEGSTLKLSSSSAADVGIRVLIKEDPKISNLSETVVLNGTTPVFTSNSYQMPTALAKKATVGTVSVYPVLDGYAWGSEPVLILESDVASKKFCRVKLHPAPEAEEDYLILVKRKAPELTDDLDTPLISNCEDALVAMAQVDMLERMRQYGKAEAKAKEVMVQIAKLKELETNQSPNVMRLVPTLGGDVQE
jgi:hypothetical protein